MALADIASDGLERNARSNDASSTARTHQAHLLLLERLIVTTGKIQLRSPRERGKDAPGGRADRRECGGRRKMSVEVRALLKESRHDGRQRRGDRRIELEACLQANFVQHLAAWTRATIGSVVRHGVVSVADGGDARRQGDRLANQSFGVAVAIGAFMVEPRYVRGEVTQRVPAAGEHFGPDYGVPLDQGALAGTQRLAFQQQLV